MSTVLVTGGTGTLGRALVPRLPEAGHSVRVLTRRSDPPLPAPTEIRRGDLMTGQGLSAALEGVDAVLHAASDPFGDPQRTDVVGTGRLVAALDPRRVRHVVYVSIVGIDRNPYGYYRAKLAAEQAIRGSGLPWSIVRATQFHNLVDILLQRAYRKRLRLIAVPRGWRAQPVDTRDLAGYLTGLLPLLPRYAVEEYAGPELRTAADLARTWRATRGLDARVVALPVSGRVSRAFRRGSNLTSGGVRGRTTWDDWLRAGDG